MEINSCPDPCWGLIAAQLPLCTSYIPAACRAWAKPHPGGRQGHLGRLSGSHSSRIWKEWLDWQLQTLTDNLQWCMATIHQHKPNVASYHNYLGMSGSQESSQQKGGGKRRFYNEKENTGWNRKGKQKPIPVCIFPLLWLLPLPSKNAAGCQRLTTHWVWGNWGDLCKSPSTRVCTHKVLRTNSSASLLDPSLNPMGELYHKEGYTAWDLVPLLNGWDCSTLT